MSDLLLVEKKGSAVIVTLNRPDNMNAISPALMGELATTFQALKAQDDFAAVILTGAGKAFCAGADLKALTEQGPSAFSDEIIEAMLSSISAFDRPIIGAINGVAAAGGFELTLLCDILVASENARFVDPHARLGMIPAWGLSQRLQRIVGINRARDLLFTGNSLSAGQAESWGLISRLVTASELLPTCEQIAEDIARADIETLIGYRRTVNEGATMDLSAALQYERQISDQHAKYQLIKSATSKENK